MYIQYMKKIAIKTMLNTLLKICNGMSVIRVLAEPMETATVQLKLNQLYLSYKNMERPRLKMGEPQRSYHSSVVCTYSKFNFKIALKKYT